MFTQFHTVLTRPQIVIDKSARAYLLITFCLNTMETQGSFSKKSVDHVLSVHQRVRSELMMFRRRQMLIRSRERHLHNFIVLRSLLLVTLAFDGGLPPCALAFISRKCSLQPLMR